MSTPEYDATKGLTATDRLLVRGARAGKSGRELSELTNGVIPPEQAMARVLDIYDQRDWLTDAQMQFALTDELLELKDSLYESAIEYKSLAHVDRLVKVLTLIDKRLSDRKFDLAKAMSEISRAQAQLMLQGISLTLERTFLELEKRYPEVQKAELYEIFQTAMPPVVMEIESHVAA